MVCAQLHDVSLGKPFVELGEVGGVGAVPSIDGLIGVAHHTQISPIAEPRLQQIELSAVQVLELVDEEVTEEPLLRVPKARLGSEEPGALDE